MTNRLARVLSLKMRKFPLKPDEVDSLDAYIDNTIPDEVLQNAITFFGMCLTFPDSKCLPRYAFVTFYPTFYLTKILIGWYNLIQKGYLHCDISIGNLVIVEDAVTTKAFEILKTTAGMRQ